MRDWLDQARLQELARRIRPTGSLIGAFPLEGGISATMTAIDIALPGGDVERFVVRQHGEHGLRNNAGIADIEFALLRLLEQAEVPAQRPIFLDKLHEFSSNPLLVISYVDGSIDVAPADERSVCDQLATYLARLHAITAATYDLTFLPEIDARLGHMLDSISTEGLLSPTLVTLRTALAPIWPPTQSHIPVVLHGDFWPGNLLWHGGQLAAAIDWEDAAAGNPLFDVASTRLELLWLFGEDAKNFFTDRYLSLTALDPAGLPFWDLCAAIDPALHLSTWGKEPVVERHMHAELAHFVDRAATALGSTVGTKVETRADSSSIR